MKVTSDLYSIERDKKTWEKYLSEISQEEREKIAESIIFISKHKKPSTN